jgi:hypothetical protein
MRGVLHIHSMFSDGEAPLDRVVQTFEAAGVEFMAVSDHAEVFSDDRMERYVALCEALSSASLLVIPGLEFALKGGTIHILGYGVKKRVRARSMEQLVDGIHAAGGIAVLAHPPAGSINMIDVVKDKLDGIEVWNVRYDGPVAPRTQSFQLLQKVRRSNPKAAAYCGIDLHQIEQARKPVFVEVEAKELSRDAILEAFRAGAFTLHRGNTVIPSSGNLTFVQQLSIALKQPLCRPWAA